MKGRLWQNKVSHLISTSIYGMIFRGPDRGITKAYPDARARMTRYAPNSAAVDSIQKVLN
jgi:hypothetical protein